VVMKKKANKFEVYFTGWTTKLQAVTAYRLTT